MTSTRRHKQSLRRPPPPPALLLLPTPPRIPLVIIIRLATPLGQRSLSPANSASTRRQRPRCSRAADQRDEIASLHALPPQGVRVAHYHSVAGERCCCITAKLILEWQMWVRIGHCGDVGCTTAFPPRTDIRRHA